MTVNFDTLANSIDLEKELEWRHVIPDGVRSSFLGLPTYLFVSDFGEYQGDRVFVKAERNAAIPFAKGYWIHSVWWVEGDGYTVSIRYYDGEDMSPFVYGESETLESAIEKAQNKF